MGKRAVGLVLVLVALMATTAACGDDDGDGGGGDRLTQAQLASRGDEVCNRLDADVKKLADDFEPTITFTPAQMQQLYQKLVPAVDAAIAGFEALEPPADVEAKYDDALAQAGTDREKLVEASESEDAAKALFEGGEDPFEATNEKLAAVGITACSGEATEGDAAPADTTTTTKAP